MTSTDGLLFIKPSKLSSVSLCTFSAPSVLAHMSSCGGGVGFLGFSGSFIKATKSASYSKYMSGSINLLYKQSYPIAYLRKVHRNLLTYSITCITNSKLPISAQVSQSKKNTENNFYNQNKVEKSLHYSIELQIGVETRSLITYIYIQLMP